MDWRSPRQNGLDPWHSLSRCLRQIPHRAWRKAFPEISVRAVCVRIFSFEAPGRGGKNDFIPVGVRSALFGVLRFGRPPT